MAADSAAINRVRQWIGDGVADTVIVDALIDADADAPAAALAVLRRLRATLILGGPLTFSVAGDYSQDGASQLAAIDSLIGTLEASTGDHATLPTVTVGRLVREDWNR